MGMEDFYPGYGVWWRLSGESGHLVSDNWRKTSLNDSLMHVMGRSGLKSLVGKAHLIREDISHEELIAPLLKDIEEMLLGYLRGGLFSDDVRAYAKATQTRKSRGSRRQSKTAQRLRK